MEQGEQAAAPRPVGGLHRALGIAGRVMITLGLLIIAFVGYQLWGTGIEFRANQRALEGDFEETQSSLLAQTVPTTVPAPTTTAPPTTTTSTVPGASTVATTSTTTTTSSTVPKPTLPPIALGDVVGRLTMPTITKSEYYIVAGVRVDDLKHGVGHYPSTPLPGQYGNAALAGHRTTYGAPFGDLDDLKVGDRLIVDTLLGEHYEYIVQGSEIIKPSETRVLSQPDDPTQATLTLTTCHPKKSTKKRLIIHSVLDTTPGVSSPLEPRMFNYQTQQSAASTAPPVLAGEGTEDTENTVTTTTVPATTVAPGSTAAPAETPAPATTVAAPATAAAPTTLPTGLAGEDVVLQDEDNLGRGWFHDGRAWPHVIFWGGLLSLIAYGAWRLGKRVGHGWVAYVAGFVPFVLVLYFFFQNVNRLLPPGL